MSVTTPPKLGQKRQERSDRSKQKASRPIRKDDKEKKILSAKRQRAAQVEPEVRPRRQEIPRWKATSSMS